MGTSNGNIGRPKGKKCGMTLEELLTKIERWYNTDGTLTVDRAQSEFESPPSDRLVSYKDIVKW
jgi:hypothetical protein